jgi:hypothetical protein
MDMGSKCYCCFTRVRDVSKHFEPEQTMKDAKCMTWCKRIAIAKQNPCLMERIMQGRKYINMKAMQLQAECECKECLRPKMLESVLVNT